MSGNKTEQQIHTIHMSGSPNSACSIGYPLQVNNISIKHSYFFSLWKHWKTFFQNLQHFTSCLIKSKKKEKKLKTFT